MIIVADENIERPIISKLRKSGFTLFSIQEHFPGIHDKVVLEKSQDTDQILLTSDTDFGELVYKHHHTYSGIVLLRLHGMSPEQKANTVANEFIGKGHDFLNAFSVIGKRSTRIRSRSGDPEFN